jgi:hypothetical protein
MSESVAVAEPAGRVKTKSSKTLFAGVLVFILLVAFATAFYFLGGVDLVSGLIGQLFATNTAPTASTSPSGQKPSAPAAAPVPANPSGLKLPAGVDEAFAKRMYVEQLESERNIEKLTADKVESFSIGTVSTVPDGTEVEITAKFRDKTTAKGVLGLAQRQGNWFFVFIAGKRGANTNGEADTVASRNDEGFVTNDTPLNNTTVDSAVLNTMLDQQVKSQEILKGISDGTFTSLTIGKVTQGPGTATLEITLAGPKAAAMKGRVLCISKDIDGTKTWFVTSFTKA